MKRVYISFKSFNELSFPNSKSNSPPTTFKSFVGAFSKHTKSPSNVGVSSNVGVGYFTYSSNKAYDVIVQVSSKKFSTYFFNYLFKTRTLGVIRV